MAHQKKFHLGWRILLPALVTFMAFRPGDAFAQVTHTYTNTNIIANNIDATRACDTPLTRSFTVTDSFTIFDVDIGVLATHTWRGDMTMTLESPKGTRVQFVDGDLTAGGSAHDFNVRLDDEATGGVVNVANFDHNVASPPYQFQLTPDNALSAFDGEISNGIWRLEICELLPVVDHGTFLRSDLFLTESPTLDVVKTSTIVSDPISGTSNPKAIPDALVEYCISISNPNNSNATGIAAADTIPANATFISGSMRSGNDCATAATIEDDNGVGSDESDPVGGSITGGTIAIAKAKLAPGQSFAFTFRISID